MKEYQKKVAHKLHRFLNKRELMYKFIDDGDILLFFVYKVGIPILSYEIPLEIRNDGKLNAYRTGILSPSLIAKIIKKIIKSRLRRL